MRTELTVAAIQRLKPGKGRREIPDAGALGLRLCIHKTGKKTWIWRYRRPNGRSAKLTLGEVDIAGKEQEATPKIGVLLTVDAARSLANECRRQIKLGIDPGEIRRDEKTEHHRLKGETVAWAMREFINRYAKRNKHWRGTAHTLGLVVDKKSDQLSDTLVEGGLAERWRDTPLSALRSRDVIAVIDDKATKARFAANGLHACLRRFLNWCVERKLLAISPLQGVKKPTKAKSRDRVLSDAEIVALWRASEKLSYPWKEFTHLLVLTAQRRSEVRGITRGEVNGDTWTIPKERMKMDAAQIVSLGSHALAIINALLLRTDNKTLLLTTTGRGPVKGFSKFKRKLDAFMREELKDAWKPWRIHDIRRTAATTFQRLGVRFEVTEAILSHKGISRSGVAGVYQRHAWTDESRDALERYGQWLFDLVEGKQSKVVKLRA